MVSLGWELAGITRGEGTEETVEEIPEAAEDFDTNWLCPLTSPILAIN